jgi:hypothetical protein
MVEMMTFVSLGLPGIGAGLGAVEPCLIMRDMVGPAGRKGFH